MDKEQDLTPIFLTPIFLTPIFLLGQEDEGYMQDAGLLEQLPLARLKAEGGW